MTSIENNQNLIIEGCYILPHHIKEFDQSYSNKIISVFLGFSNYYINEKFTSNIVEYRNAVENRRYPEERTIADLINEHSDFRRKCLDNGVNYFEIDKDYQQEIMKVYNFIENQKLAIEYRHNNTLLFFYQTLLKQ
ncbi:hypothetical protein [Chengkuizengella axinellae]|uniref:Uncharacterized protein n=1 Tax=Chengkuizengella axinellae TaxID=3064388 RepID=A0ABT9J1Z1_9BACL|nr:hypothetical protein [Chengkuizengella sp. 2205SS18-9]MDP5275635.1 hypothetical protein [Chengkuizengella sp. 2205SS18-9]